MGGAEASGSSGGVATRNGGGSGLAGSDPSLRGALLARPARKAASFAVLGLRGFAAKPGFAPGAAWIGVSGAWSLGSEHVSITLLLHSATHWAAAFALQVVNPSTEHRS